MKAKLRREQRENEEKENQKEKADPESFKLTKVAERAEFLLSLDSLVYVVGSPF